MNPDVHEILKLARGFMESRILLTAIELNLFEYTQSPLKVDEVADLTHANIRAINMLVDSLAAMGFLVKQDNTYKTNPSLSNFLSEKSPNSILPLLQHTTYLWKRWSHLTEIVRGIQIPESAGEAKAWSKEALKAFIGAMNVIGSELAREVVEYIDIAEAKSVLDVGGASGTYTIAFLQAAPEMKATLFDRPEVIDMAREHLDKAGLLERVILVPGNFYTDELPPENDIAFVSAIIHQNSPEENIELFRKIFRALNKGGRIIIRDFIMNSDRTRPKEGAIFAINMLVNTAGGGTFTLNEIDIWLKEAGFRQISLIRDGEKMDQLVQAIKP
jgi:predicted O-methyltransferase YrrM